MRKKKPKKPTKADLERKHFKERMKERHGIDVSNNLYNKIIRSINGNGDDVEVKFVKKSTLRTSVWSIKLGDEDVIAVYDRKRRQLVTALPKNCHERNML